MITLNLISPKQKRLLKVRQFYQLLENFLGVLVIYSIILAIILIPIHQSINQIDKNIENKKQEEQIKNASMTQQVASLNDQIDTLHQIQKEFYNWSKYLIDVSNLVPADISLNQISNSLEKKDFIIRGYAKNRDSLIIFKANLENSRLFKEINIPISNFLTQEEITFEISGILN